MELCKTKDGFEKPKDKITQESFDQTGELSVHVICDEGTEQSHERLVREVCDFMKDNYGLDVENADLGQCLGDSAKTDENGNTVYSKVNVQLKLKDGK